MPGHKLINNFHYALTAEQLQSFQENGYLLIHGFFNPEESKLLQQWAQEVYDLPRTPGVPWMPYEEVNSQGQQVLCRTENFANSHPGFDSFLRGQRAMSVLQQLAKEEMLLFKEKINYKLAGSGGFPPHIDASGYTRVKGASHLSILAAVDEMNMTNGGLEVIKGSHCMQVPLLSNRCIEPGWIESHDWTPCDLQPGDILIFGSYLAHRSRANTSSKNRRAIYATYNPATEGDLHDEYYADREKFYPATHMRKEGESYTEGQTRFAFATPMLTVDQLALSQPKTHSG